MFFPELFYSMKLSETHDQILNKSLLFEFGCGSIKHYQHQHMWQNVHAQRLQMFAATMPTNNNKGKNNNYKGKNQICTHLHIKLSEWQFNNACKKGACVSPVSSVYIDLSVKNNVDQR